mmetsp:Transcript_15389/g.32604  ORF Transcript_15389/g.32604 Transcript_15389/m.32604 type:complete len:307 (+) Transcript_15389:855-1775(+)
MDWLSPRVARAVEVLHRRMILLVVSPECGAEADNTLPASGEVARCIGRCMGRGSGVGRALSKSNPRSPVLHRGIRSVFPSLLSFWLEDPEWPLVVGCVDMPVLLPDALFPLPPLPPPPGVLLSLVVLNESAKLSKFIFIRDATDELKPSSFDSMSEIDEDEDDEFEESSEKSMVSSSIRIESRMESASAERVERRLDRNPPPPPPPIELDRPRTPPPALRSPEPPVPPESVLSWLEFRRDFCLEGVFLLPSASETVEIGLLFDVSFAVSFASDSSMGFTLFEIEREKMRYGVSLTNERTLDNNLRD